MPLPPHSNVLLVEDDDDLREAIIVSLKMAAIDFLAFDCAEQALPQAGVLSFGTVAQMAE